MDYLFRITVLVRHDDSHLLSPTGYPSGYEIAKRENLVNGSAASIWNRGDGTLQVIAEKRLGELHAEQQDGGDGQSLHESRPKAAVESAQTRAARLL